MFNFITTCGGPYSMDYANKAYSMMSRHAGMNFKAYCITERPDELRSEITGIAPGLDVKGWWNKVLAFGPDMPDGWIVVADIDLIIANSIKEELEYCFNNVKQIAAYADAIHWMGCKFSSSFMVFRKGALNSIYENFKSKHAELANYPGGDQVWIGPQLEHVVYIDEIFPNFKRSLKFDLSELSPTTIKLPIEISKDIKIVDFHGRPKPHQIATHSFVKDNWC